MGYAAVQLSHKPLSQPTLRLPPSPDPPQLVSYATVGRKNLFSDFGFRARQNNIPATERGSSVPSVLQKLLLQQEEIQKGSVLHTCLSAA